MNVGRILGWAAWLALAGLVAEDVRVQSTDELRTALRAAVPGTRVLLEPGDYEGGLYLENLQGRRDAPIVVAAADPEKRPVIRGTSVCLQLSDPCFLELRDLVLEGGRSNGLNIDDGGSYDTPAHHLTLHNLVVRDAGAGGNQDGIKLSGVDDFTVEGCTVERWGRGGSGIDMVGCHRGVIVGCVFRDREEGGAANAVQTKGGSRAVRVARCRFEGAIERGVNIGGSTGLDYFRPRPKGYEAQEITVEGCTFVGQQAPVAFVGVDGAIVRLNTIYRPTAWVFRILQETRGEAFAPCRSGVFARNLVVYRRDEIRSAVNVGPGTAPETFRIEGNYWYAADAPARSRPQLPVAESGGRGGEDPLLLDPEGGDFTLRDGSPARECGAGALPSLPGPQVR